MTKIAFFDLTDCEGCELQFLSLKEKLFDLFQDFDVLSWRLLQEKQIIGFFDIAFISGTPTTKEEQRLLKEIRKRTKFLVALGSCATTGGIPGATIEEKKRPQLLKYVYGSKYIPKATSYQPLRAYVKVDKEINGCPIILNDLEEFIKQMPAIASPNPSPFPAGTCRFVPDYISKIEGHGSLKVDLKKNKAQFEVEEGERLIEGLLLGKNFIQAPFITSRICGICPVAHNLASIKALEKALNIQPNEVVINLRKLLLYGQVIHSHLFHLFFLSLPDFLHKRSGIEVAKSCPAEFHIALNIKRVSEKIISAIGGQTIHPVFTTVGGFKKIPSKNQLQELYNDLEQTIDEAEDLVRFFLSLKYPKLRRPTEYLALNSNPNYEFYDGNILSNSGANFSPKDYKKEIKEEIKPYSTAKFGRRDKAGFMVGAIARLSLHQNLLNGRAKKFLEDSNLYFPTYNSFHNNIAQSVEILHLFEESFKTLENLLSLKDSIYQKAAQLPNFKTKGGHGIDCLEAPRGTLYHYYEIDANGKIKNCDIITPTVQNLSNIEEDAKTLLLETKGLQREKRIRLLEMLIRAYDPCITCAVH